MRHAVVRRADQLHAGLDDRVARLAQLVVRLADLQTEVIEADTPSRRDGRRVRTHLDEQQLVVRAA